MNFRAYSPYTLKETYWLGTDSNQRYLDNLKNNYEKLRSNYWIDRTIKYTFNSHGFRCDEFTSDDSIMFLGCSHTLGVGLPIEDTWAYQVAKNLNLKNVNLGQGGSSSDTAYRLASYYIEQLKPKIVVIRPPDPARFEMFDCYNKPTLHSPQYQESVTDYKDWFSCEHNHILNEEKNLLAIEYLCTRFNTKFVRPPEIDGSLLVRDVARD